MSHERELPAETSAEVIDWMAGRLAWERMVSHYAETAATGAVNSVATPSLAAPVERAHAAASSHLRRRFGRRKLAV